MTSRATVCADGLLFTSVLDPRYSRYMNNHRYHYPHGAPSFLHINARNALATPINNLQRHDGYRNNPKKHEHERISRSSTDDAEPISLDNFDEDDQSQLTRRISFDVSVGELSFDHGNSDQKKPGNGLDTVHEEQDWTRKIVFVASSSGNLIEDLENFEGDGDDLSTSSMTTIIGSEHSSVADATDLGGDLEGIFVPKDEMDQVPENDDNSYKNSDPIHSKNFVVFGNDDDTTMTLDKNDLLEIPSRTGNTPMRGPRTSKVNPMTAQESPTANTQELRRNALSRCRLETPKDKNPRKRKGKKKQNKTTVKQHSYLLRKGSCSKNDTTHESLPTSHFESSASAPTIKNSRLLRNIKSFNRPVTKDDCGCGSVSPTTESTVESNDASVRTPLRKDVLVKKVAPTCRSPKRNKKSSDTGKIKIYELKKLAAHNHPGFKTMDDNFLGRVPSNVSKNDKLIVHARTSKVILTDNSQEKMLKKCKNKRQLAVSRPCLRSNKLKTSRVIVGGEICFAPDNKEDVLTTQARTEMFRDSSTTRSSSLKKSNVRNKSDFPSPPSATIRSPRRRNQTKPSRGLQSATAATCPKTGKEESINSTPVKEKASSTKTTQKKNSKQQSKTQPKRTTRITNAKHPRGKRNIEAITKLSTRIAKKFLLSPPGCKGRGRPKTYFGTIVSKRDAFGANGTYGTVWHVVYDDGDEENFDKREYRQALNMYNSLKYLDDKRKDEPSVQPEEKRKNPRSTENAQQLSQSLNQRKEALLQINGQSKVQNGSPLPQYPMSADTVIQTLRPAKRNERKTRDQRDRTEGETDV